jgi:PAS domain-containing protein
MLAIAPASGAIVDATPAACAYYGWSHEEITQLNIANINTLSRFQRTIILSSNNTATFMEITKMHGGFKKRSS